MESANAIPLMTHKFICQMVNHSVRRARESCTAGAAFACFLMLAMMISVPHSAAAAAHPAFPGAVGFGAASIGGRGGRVIEVSNLDDSGPGSLRAACESSGARTVVFRTAGTVRLKSRLRISEPYITIAGQTAPGGGILLRDAGLYIETHDVIIRHLRVRLGDSRSEPPGAQDCLTIHASQPDQTYNVIIDHCSFSWSVDEIADTWGPVRDVTIQWCILSEALRQTPVRDEAHSMGVLFGKASNRTTLYGCLFAHNNARNPRIQGGRRDVINNTFYNWGGEMGRISGFPELNFAGNYYRPGPGSRLTVWPLRGEEFGRIYVRDNIAPNRPDATTPEWDIVDEAAPSADHMLPAPLDGPTYPLIAALRSYWCVMERAGATLPCRDAVDRRILKEVRTRQGSIIDYPDQSGGYPDIQPGIPSPDTDGDGMPDQWELRRGLDPLNQADGPIDRDTDGYSNLEEYINSAMALAEGKLAPLDECSPQGG